MAVTTSLGFNLFSTWNGKGTRAASRDISSVGAVTSGIAQTIGVAMGAASTAVTAWGVNAVKAGFGMNTLMQTARVGLTSMLGSAEAAEKQLKKLSDFTSESPFSKTIFIEAQQQLIGYGVAAEKVIPILDAVQNTVIAGGGTEQNLSRVVEVLARMRSAGQVTIGDFNELGTEGVNAAKIIAGEFGTTEADIRKQVVSGKLSVEEFYTAFTTGSEKAFGDMSEGVRTTSVGMLDRLKGVQRRIGEIFATPFIDPMGGGLLVDLGNQVADVLNKIEDAAAPLAPLITAKLAPAFERIGETIGRITEGISTQGITSFFRDLAQYLPIIGGAGAAAFASFGSSLLSSIPGLSMFAGALNPISLAIIAIVGLSPALRAALVQVFQAFAPLLPVVVQLAQMVAGLLVQGLNLVAAIISGPVVSALNVVIPLIAGLITWVLNTKAALITIGVVAGVVFTTMAVQAVISITRQAIAWTVLNTQMALSKAALISTRVIMVASWIMMATVAMANAIRMAAAWFIALGPIGWVIAIVIGLVALIILNWDKVKRVTIMVWTAIVNFVKMVWNAIWTFIGPTVMKIWGVVRAAWDKLRQTTTYVFNAIKRIFVNSWNTLWRFIGPVVKKIADFVKARWNEMKLAFQIMARGIKTVWNWFKTNVIDRLVLGVKVSVELIKARWNVMKNAATTVFNFIKSKVEWFRDKFKAVGNKIGEFVDKIKSKWGALKDTAKSVFNKIRDLVKKPIKFVINTVYNNGIRKFWNQISDKLFGGDNKLPTVGMNGWRSGGPVRGQGTWKSDSIPARLTAGEHVWTPREVRAAGGHGRVMQMRSAVLGGRPVSAGPQGGNMRFKGGGFWDTIGDATKLASDSAKDLFGNVKEGDFYGALANSFESLSPLTNKIGGLLNGLKFDSKIKPFGDMIKAGLKKAQGKLRDYLAGLLGMGGGMGGGPGNYKAMGEWIKKAVPGTTITSGLRSGSGTSYHNSGKAIDMAFSDGSERRGGGIAKKAYQTIKSTWMQSILELIWDFSPDGPSRGVKNGKAHTYTGSSAGPGTHADHIHWANEGSSGRRGGGGSFGGGVGQWADTVSSVLRSLGIFNNHNLTAVLECIRQESSGRQDLQNNWDINAQNGIPSKGLMQVIPPTFASYAGKYKNRGIWDPFANIYAAVRYARSRYGDNWTRAITAPGGYAGGGMAKPLSFDNGGLLPVGYSVVHNGTGRPEPVGHDLINGNGDTYIFNVDGGVLTERKFQDLVVNAISEARDKGRKV